jgi:hypothetical protein
MGVRIALWRRVVLGTEAVVAWLNRYNLSNDRAFGNPALLADVRIFGDDDLQGFVGLKLYLPTLGDLGEIEYNNIATSRTTTPYEPGFYMPQTLTLRPDFKFFMRRAGLVLAAEIGLDFLINTASDNVRDVLLDDTFSFRYESFLNLHAGIQLGYLFAPGIVFAYWELALAKLFQLAVTYGARDDSTLDLPVSLMTGPGIKLQLRYFEAGVALAFPATEGLAEALDAVVSFQVGGRWQGM